MDSDVYTALYTFQIISKNGFDIKSSFHYICYIVNAIALRGEGTGHTSDLLI